MSVRWRRSSASLLHDRCRRRAGARVQRHAAGMRSIFGSEAPSIERRSRAESGANSMASRTRSALPARLGHERDTRAHDGRSRRLRVLHIEDSELDHELTVAHLRRGGLRRATRCASRREARVPRGARSRALGRGPVGLQPARLLRPGGARAAEGERLDVPFILVSGEIGEDTAVEAMRNGASDYLLKNNLARLAPGDAARDRGDARRGARAEPPTASWRASKQRLRELAQHLQTSVEMERAAIAREIHDDVGGSLTALKFDLAWIARHAEHARACSERAQSGARDGDATRSRPASASCTTCARPSSSRAWWRRCNGWRAASRSAPASLCSFRTSHETVQLPARRAAGGLPHRAGGADQHQQARAARRRVEHRPVAGRRRAVARGQRQRPRPVAATTWPRRAASASAACTSAPAPSAAGST